MKIKSVALVLFIVLACLMITPAMAETLTGDLGSSSWNTTNYAFAAASSIDTSHINGIRITDIEKTEGYKSLVYFSTKTANDLMTFDVGAPSGGSAPFIAYEATSITNMSVNASSRVIGSGTIGYQRTYNNDVPPVEQMSYVYVLFDSYNVTGLSGARNIRLIYNHTLLSNISSTKASSVLPSSGLSCFVLGTDTYIGYLGTTGGLYYTQNKEATAYAYYSVTKPSGLGISGTVNKTNGLGGTLTYPSRIFITDVNYQTITSELLVNANPYYFTTNHTQVRVNVRTANDVWYNGSLLFSPGGITPTVTPTPIAGAIYTMSTSTDYVNVSGTNTATIASITDPSLADLKYIGAFLSDTPSGAQSNFYESGSTVHALSYTLVGGTWYGYDSADVDYNNVKGGLPNPLTLKWDTTSGDKTLHVTLQNSAGDYTYLTRTIHVGQGSTTLIQTRAQAMDGTNGGSLGMVAMQIYNHNTQTWTNLSPNDGLGTIVTPANTILSFYAQKSGFTSGSLLNQPARGDLIYSINLFTGPAVPAGYVNYFVTVKDNGGFPIGGAQIVITPSSGTTKYGTSSTSGGSQIFNLTNSTLYTWTVEKSGYSKRSGSFTTPSSGSANLDVIMYPAVTPTRTTAPIPTGSWTVNPSYTPSGNMTGFWSPWVNVYSMMGASSDEIPLLIAGLIIVLCMAAGAGMAGVLGAEVAMGFGAILCVSLGLIPIWVVLAIIILGFLFYGLKVVR